MRETGIGFRTLGHMVAEMAAEMMGRTERNEVGPAPTVIDVVPPRAWVESVIKEAERFCREAAMEVAQ